MRKGVSLNLALVIVLSTLGLWNPRPRSAFAEDLSCKISDEAIIAASKIRNLAVKQKTPCLMHGKDEVKSYLLDTIKTKIPAQKLEAEEVIYKAFGFLPKNFDYKTGLIDLYLDQLGGYYDPIKNHYVMANWIPRMLQTSVAVHELTHALQDQHFNLDTFMDHTQFTTDELMARSALVEGDATAVMMDYSFTMMGQSPLSKRQDVSSIIFQNSAGALLMPGMQKIPMSLKLLLIFPYTSGLRFAHTGLMQSDYASLDKMYKKPPQSTEEILHPELYANSEPSFRKIDITEIAPFNSELVFKDTLGEFSISALLSSHELDKTKIADIASGWGGDLIGLFKLKSGQLVAKWKIAWDTNADAEMFCGAYKSLIPKIKSYGLSSAQSDRLAIECKGRDVLIVWES